MNEHDYNEETNALTEAAFHCNPEATELLLLAGANTDYWHEAHGSALNAVLHRGNWSTCSMEALELRKRTVDVLLSHGFDIDAPGVRRWRSGEG